MKTAAATAGDPRQGRIGPNAITRIAEALLRLHGPATARSLFAEAGMAHHLAEPPTVLVDERDVMSLHRAGRRQLGLTGFAPVARLAGELTGDYVVAHRIPVLAQRLLRPLPARLAGRLLGRAIAAHAWTFVGSGVFRCRAVADGLLLTIEDSPLARDAVADAPLCGYYAATFQRIFQRVVCASTRVVEIG